MNAQRVFLFLLLFFVAGFAGLYGIGYFLFGPIPWQTQHASMEFIVDRAKPLIDAIELYDNENSGPPPNLESLVPKYITSIPENGMRSFREFEYHVGPKAKELYCGNPWVLTVFTPRGVLNFDMILYFPNQNYPASGYGGSLERIGNWAYVHE